MDIELKAEQSVDSKSDDGHPDDPDTNIITIEQKCLKRLNSGMCRVSTGLIGIFLLVVLPLSLGSQKKPTECLSESVFLGSNTSSSVSTAIYEHCDCIPKWMEGDVFFEPLITLFFAISTVTVLVNYNRISQVFPSITQLFFDSTNPESILKVFHSLPESTQSTMLQALKLAIPNMPELKNHQQGKPNHTRSNAVSPRVESKRSDFTNNVELDWLDVIFGEIKGKFTALAHSTLAAEENLKSNIIHDIEELLNQVLVHARQKADAEIIDVESGTSLDDASIITSSEVSDTVQVKRLSLVAQQEANQDETSHQEDEINPEFKTWLKNNASVFWSEILSSQDKLCEEAEQVDTTVMLFIELVIGIWILIDYFVVQTHPSGPWQCQWAYFSAVVMYKPFTVPMWFCLTLVSHYTFVDDRYRNFKQDAKTGTPFSAPFTRSLITLLMIAIIAWMQFMWFTGTMVIAAPLMIVFLPVVVVIGLILPYLSTELKKITGIVRYDIEWLTKFVRKHLKWAKDNTDDVNELLVKPILITETVLSLKASATQLVSVSMLSLVLLPFLTSDLSWSEGASQYLSLAFDLPQLVRPFFEWPKFQQPRLSFQLALGLTIAVLQLILRFCKRRLVKYSSFLTMPKQNKDSSFIIKFERGINQVVIFTSWGFFHRLMMTAQAASEASYSRLIDLFYFMADLTKNRLFLKIGFFFFSIVGSFVWVVLGLWMLTSAQSLFLIVGYCLFSFMNPVGWYLIFINYFFIEFLFSKRTKYFGGESSDKEILDFSLSEDSMYFDRIYIRIKCQVDKKTLSIVEKRCPWLEVDNNSKLRMDGVIQMFLAAHVNNVELLKESIDLGVDIEAVTKSGQTPLTNAASNNSLDTLKELINSGATIEVVDKSGRTPLSYAASNNSLDTLKELISSGANIEAVDKDGRTPLAMACRKTFKELISAGANQEAVDKNGKSALANAKALHRFIRRRLAARLCFTFLFLVGMVGMIVFLYYFYVVWGGMGWLFSL